jgi:uncharacterized protein YoxC
MELQIAAIIISVAGAIISLLLAIVIALISWTYRTDRTEKNLRIQSLESTIQKMLTEWMSRPEMQGVVARVEKEFMQKHEVLTEKIDGISKGLGDVRLGLKDIQINLNSQMNSQMAHLGESLGTMVSKQIKDCSDSILSRVSEHLQRHAAGEEKPGGLRLSG